MKKCFDNIKTLDMGMGKPRERWEASHMNSTEGEKVEFSSVVHLEGAVEVGGAVGVQTVHCVYCTCSILVYVSQVH